MAIVLDKGNTTPVDPHLKGKSILENNPSNPLYTELTAGSNPYRVPSALATTNDAVVKASAGKLFKVVGVNTSASIKYIKFYNKASGLVVGTDIPVITVPAPVGFFSTDIDLEFDTGISIAMTGAAADNDTTALTAGDIVGLNVFYS